MLLFSLRKKKRQGATLHKRLEADVIHNRLNLWAVVSMHTLEQRASMVIYMTLLTGLYRTQFDQ